MEEKYDELMEFIIALDRAIEYATSEDYEDRIKGIKEEVQEELEKVQEDLRDEQRKEEKALEREYIRSVM